MQIGKRPMLDDDLVAARVGDKTWAQVSDALFGLILPCVETKLHIHYIYNSQCAQIPKHLNPKLFCFLLWSGMNK